MPIVLSGQGSYSDSAAFLHRLHQSLPDTGVVAFELSGQPGRGKKTQFRFNLVWYAAPTLAEASP